MKVKLAVAFAVLLFAGVAKADEIQTPNGIVFTPDGSVVTSVQNVELFAPATIVSFTFADGTGLAEAEGAASAQGYIYFTIPVSDVSFVWNGDIFAATDNLNDSFNSYNASNPNYNSGTATFAGPGITWIGWGTYSDLSPAGISSLTYTLDTADPPSMPEPSSLLLSGMGLAAFIGLARRNRTNSQTP